MKAVLTSPIWHGKIPAGSVGEVVSFGDRLEIDIDGEIYLVPLNRVEVLQDGEDSATERQVGIICSE